MSSGIWVRGIHQVFEGYMHESGTCPPAALCSRWIEWFATHRRHRIGERRGAWSPKHCRTIPMRNMICTIRMRELTGKCSAWWQHRIVMWLDQGVHANNRRSRGGMLRWRWQTQSCWARHRQTTLTYKGDTHCYARTLRICKDCDKYLRVSV